MKSVELKPRCDRIRAHERVVTSPVALTTSTLLAKGSSMAASQPIQRTQGGQLRLRFNRPPINEKWTKESVAAELRRLAGDDGVLQSNDCTRYLAKRVCQLFGTFGVACDYAGIRPRIFRDGRENSRVCEVDGCNELTRSTGATMCETHYYRIRRNGTLVKKNGHESTVNHAAFDELTDATAWVLGLIWTDGCLMGNTILITSKDVAMLELVESVLGGSGLVRPRKLDRKGRQYWDVRIFSPKMTRTLRSYGLTERKSLTVRWPQELPRELDGAFLRGAIDGDGSVLSKSRYGKNGSYIPQLQVLINTGSDVFGADIGEVLSLHDIRWTMARRQSVNCVMSRISILEQASQRRLFDLLHGAGGPALARKKIPYVDWMGVCRKGRRVGTGPCGERGGGAKLTQAIVDEIRDVYSKKGHPTRKELGAKYGVHFGTIQAIVKRRTWK